MPPPDLNSHNQNPEVFWYSDHFNELLHRSLEGEVFVYNPLTGHTHILNQLSWQLLQACAETQRSNDYLLSLVNPEHDQLVRQEVEDHLWQLQQLELIQVQNPCN